MPYNLRQLEKTVMIADTDHPSDEHVRIRAYMIWEREGRPDGHALAHWIKAKEEIEAELRPDDVQASQQDMSSPGGDKTSPST